MAYIYLPREASKAKIREAENARENRLEIVKALSQGQVSRRELVKWGLVTGAGLLAPIGGLNPFVKSARAEGGSGIPTGSVPSPLFGVQPFTQPMLRLEVLIPAPAIIEKDPNDPSETIVCCKNQAHPNANLLGPDPNSVLNAQDSFDADRRSCQKKMKVDPALGGGVGPCEGRPFDPFRPDDWAHQIWTDDDAVHLPKVTYDVWQRGAQTNGSYQDGVTSGVSTVPFKFHPGFPAQGPDAMWTFNGTMPPKLVLGRYGEPILFRHHNDLPADVRRNNGFGRNTISTHEHNGHHGYENDGFTGAFFYPGQYYDYHWPIVHAGFRTINTGATEKRCGSPDGSGGITKLPGDWQETMSTHWFHDHMFGFTAQNVYKGVAAMFNIYSSIDRGNEAINDGVNFQLPSGSRKDWGNLDYDVNLMVADKAWDQNGQLYFDIFNLDGFLGDVMTVNGCYKPFFQVEARKYRFRILNASVSRFFKIALCDSSGRPVQMIQIGNDGNLLPQAVPLTALDEQGIAERYDIVIDFSNYVNQSLFFVNLCEHQDGVKPSKDLRLADALTPGKSNDPCVGKFLEFRVGNRTSDPSKVPSTLIPNPDLSRVSVVRTRTFEFGKGGGQDGLPWSIKVDGGQSLNADYTLTSALPKMGTSEIWTLKNGGGGWDHPIHIHFEEGQILKRNGSASNVPAWEKGRKDVYRLRPSGEVTVQLQFREFAGMYMEHCHNTQHEDNAMLLRWDVDDRGNGGLVPLPSPNPSPQGQYKGQSADDSSGGNPTTTNTRVLPGTSS